MSSDIQINWVDQYKLGFSLISIEFCPIYRVIQNISDQKPKVRYLVAVDDSKVTLKQITKAVSKKLGTGKFKQVTKEDALLNKEISVTKTSI